MVRMAWPLVVVVDQRWKIEEQEEQMNSRSRLPYSTRDARKRAARKLLDTIGEPGRRTHDVAEALGFTPRQEAQLVEVFGRVVPHTAQQMLQEIETRASRQQAFEVVATAANLLPIQENNSIMTNLDGKIRQRWLPQPTPAMVTTHFLETYGADRLYFTVVPFDLRGRMVNESTFAKDNIDQLVPWLMLQLAKMSSGKIVALSIVIRVFDLERMVETDGPKGHICIPEKDMFMFYYDGNGLVGFDSNVTRECHCLDPITGDMLEPEFGVRYASSIEIVELLQERTASWQSDE